MTASPHTLAGTLATQSARDELVAQGLADLVDCGTELLERFEDRGVDTVAGLAEAVDGLLGFVGSATRIAQDALEDRVALHGDSSTSSGGTGEGSPAAGSASVDPVAGSGGVA